MNDTELAQAIAANRAAAHAQLDAAGWPRRDETAKGPNGGAA